MAGVLERIRWPQKKMVDGHSSSAPRVDLRVLELQAAKEVIQNRYEEVRCEANSYEETEQWPREFSLGD
jgi:hypothetical protein